MNIYLVKLTLVWWIIKGFHVWPSCVRPTGTKRFFLRATVQFVCDQVVQRMAASEAPLARVQLLTVYVTLKKVSWGRCNWRVWSLLHTHSPQHNAAVLTEKVSHRARLLHPCQHSAPQIGPQTDRARTLLRHQPVPTPSPRRVFLFRALFVFSLCCLCENPPLSTTPPLRQAGVNGRRWDGDSHAVYG